MVWGPIVSSQRLAFWEVLSGISRIDDASVLADISQLLEIEFVDSNTPLSLMLAI
jgi:hypothetical protein